MNSRRKQPLAEVFGFPADNFTEQAARHRRLRLCPFHNVVPNCTKDRANDPLGVCSIHHGEDVVITCPIRFRQDWLIAEHAAQFFFDAGIQWTSLSEVRLRDKRGQSAGNIDLVLVAYDNQGRIVDFGAVEVQAVYISGNVRRPFEYYLQDPGNRYNMDWSKLADYYPKPDYLSSSRKRLIPQLLYKGAILRGWQKKQAVVVQSSFYHTLPGLPEVDPAQAEICWFLYDLERQEERFTLVFDRAVYTEFWPALNTITTPEAGPLSDFVELLQSKLDQKQGGTSPDIANLLDASLS